MKLRDLTKIAERAETARNVLAHLDKTQGVEIDLLKADGRFVHYGNSVNVMEDAAFIETVKTYLRASQTKILDEALAQLAEHGIELDPPDVENDGEDDAALEDAA
jgi:hypothetical protein